MDASSRSAVRSDGERPPWIWRIRFGSPTAFRPNAVGLRPVLLRNAFTRELNSCSNVIVSPNGEGLFSRPSTHRKYPKYLWCPIVVRCCPGVGGGRRQCSGGAPPHEGKIRGLQRWNGRLGRATGSGGRAMPPGRSEWRTARRRVLSRAWSACVHGAHLAARHRCDIPARSRPRPRRTPILG